MNPVLGPIDRYHPLDVIGSGGFGTVYRARHMHTGEIVALKVLHEPMREATQRVLREARALAGLVHPNVVRVLDCGLGPEGQIFVAMDLAHGVPLAQLLSAGALPPARAVDLTRQLLAGLGAAHARGVVHRDVKPANVVVDSRTVDNMGRGVDHLRLIDFGISRVADATLPSEGQGATRPGMSMGTPGYMAPEQLGTAHAADSRADLYSAGVILYQMLSGRLPHNAPTYEDYVVSLRTSSPPPISTLAMHVWPSLEAVVMRSIAFDPARRFGSAEEFAQALDAAMNDPAAISQAPTMPRNAAIPMSTPHSPRVGPGQYAPNAPPVPMMHSSGPTPGPMMHSYVTSQRKPASAAFGAVIALGLVAALAIGGTTVWFLATRGASAPEGASASASATATVTPTPTSTSTSTSTPTPTPTSSVAIRGKGNAPTTVVTPTTPAVTPPIVTPAAAVSAETRPPCGHPGTLPVVVGSAPGVRIGPGRVVGKAAPAWMTEVARRGAGAVAICRPQCGSELVNVDLFVQSTGGITIAQPSTGANPNKGDATVASCVASNLKAAAPPHAGSFGEGQGIVTFSVLLEEKR